LEVLEALTAGPLSFERLVFDVETSSLVELSEDF